MKEYLHDLLAANREPGQGRNLIREYLQARILESLQRCGAMVPLAFQGGTALRFLYHIPRFSEDLDFSLENPDAGYDLHAYLKAIQGDFQQEGYNLNIKVNDSKAVHSAMIHFYGLLNELGLSPLPAEALSIKIEVDTRPPAGALLEVDLVRRYITLRLQHHDRSSLLAGKLHALLQRNYTKGRDLYDLMWYLSDPLWPEPNLVLLRNALIQTGYSGETITSANWRGAILKQLYAMDWDTARKDVRPFLEKPSEIEFLTLENLEKLLTRHSF